jgi:site-specific DNA recombinase
MEIALYARVSTGRQQQTHTIEQQLERLRMHVQTHCDWQLAAAHIYRDDGYSGATLKRPGLDRLRDQAALAAFELVVMTTPDRLARNYVHQVLLIDELQAVGCQVAFLDRGMSDDPHDQLLLQIRGAVAEYERTLIAERMRRGRLAKLRNGQLLPWPAAPFGYLLDVERPRDPQRVQIDPVKGELVKQIFAWYTDPQQAVSLHQIAKRLSAEQIPTPKGNVRWHGATLRGILRNPVYTGTAYAGRRRPVPPRQRRSALQPVGHSMSSQPTPPAEWIAIPVPALIDQETFAMAQTRLDQNKQLARRNNTTHDYLLRGLVSCAACQLACTGRAYQAHAYYVCNGRSAAKGERCPARYAPADQLDAVVWQDLCQLLSHPSLIAHELQRAQAGEWLPQSLQARRRTLEQAIAQLERQQARLLEVYLAEIIGQDEFERKRSELAQTLDGLHHQCHQLETQAQQLLDVAAYAAGIGDFCQRVQPTLDGLTFPQRRQLVELLVDRVVVAADQVEIRYAIPTSPKGETQPFCHLRLDYLQTRCLLV